jgi:hypothetical protein
MAKKKRRTKVSRKKKATTKKVTRKKVARKKAAPRKQRAVRGLAGVSTEALQNELERRASQLHARRDELLAELAALDAELGTSSAAAKAPARKKPGRPVGSGRGRGRGKNTMSLVEALKKVLTGQTMSVTDMCGAVKKVGYKSSSANFRTIVNQALINNPKIFNRVARGKYTAK